MIQLLKVGDRARVRRDDRHPKGQVVIIRHVLKRADDGKPYYCQTEGGYVCCYYGDKDLEEVKE